MTDDPLLALITLGIILVISISFFPTKPVEEIPLHQTSLQQDLSDGFIRANLGPWRPPTPALASLADPEIEELFIWKDDLFTRIVFCESSFNPDACSYRNCGAGMGLVQFIPSTWNEVITKAPLPDYCKQPITSVAGFQTDKSHPVFDPVCNLEAGWWLYQTKGWKPWGSSNKNWGSYYCFKHLIQ